ncbi:GFA family protein [Bosea sp. OAE752]|uniref:GFA family protein n=1 Tax=Bosea sp. OAE752 TaxID=2663873 RepID=UPI003D22F759
MRTGVCHCQTCRRETGSAFMAFAVWPSDAVRVTGRTSQWTSSTDHRTFCPSCGSTLFASSDGSNEIEIRIGSLDDAPSTLTPQYELWVPRREHWLSALQGTDQFEGNRDSANV